MNMPRKHIGGLQRDDFFIVPKSRSVSHHSVIRFGKSCPDSRIPLECSKAHRTLFIENKIYPAIARDGSLSIQCDLILVTAFHDLIKQDRIGAIDFGVNVAEHNISIVTPVKSAGYC